MTAEEKKRIVCLAEGEGDLRWDVPDSEGLLYRRPPRALNAWLFSPVGNQEQYTSLCPVIPKPKHQDKWSATPRRIPGSPCGPHSASQSFSGMRATSFSGRLLHTIVFLP